MPYFKLSVRTPTNTIQDAEGFSAPDIDAAMDEARESAAELWADGIRLGEDRSGWTVQILDEYSRPVRTLPLMADQSRPCLTIAGARTTGGLHGKASGSANRCSETGAAWRHGGDTG